MQVIPEELRASIMNWFRVPMNLLTCAGLLLLHNNTIIGSNSAMFAICTGMLLIALFCSSLFNRRYSSKSIVAEVLTSDADDKQPLTVGM